MVKLFAHQQCTHNGISELIHKTKAADSLVRTKLDTTKDLP